MKIAPLMKARMKAGWAQSEKEFPLIRIGSKPLDLTSGRIDQFASRAILADVSLLPEF